MYICCCRVQDIDGSYFESFTALAWKQENQRQSFLQAAEAAVAEAPPHESEVGITPIDCSMPQNDKDKLYVEMLYTIANAVSSWGCLKTENIFEFYDLNSPWLSCGDYVELSNCFH